MTTDIEDYCHRCVRCALAKEGKKCRTTMGPLQAKRPLDVVAMVFTVLEPGTNCVEKVLIMTDGFTKYTQAFPTNDQNARTVARVLVKEWFVRFRVPRRRHSDQGRNFESEIVQEHYVRNSKKSDHSLSPRVEWTMRTLQSYVTRPTTNTAF